MDSVKCVNLAMPVKNKREIHWKQIRIEIKKYHLSQSIQDVHKRLQDVHKDTRKESIRD